MSPLARVKPTQKVLRLSIVLSTVRFPTRSRASYAGTRCAHAAPPEHSEEDWTSATYKKMTVRGYNGQIARQTGEGRGR